MDVFAIENAFVVEFAVEEFVEVSEFAVVGKEVFEGDFAVAAVEILVVAVLVEMKVAGAIAADFGDEAFYGCFVLAVVGFDQLNLLDHYHILQLLML